MNATLLHALCMKRMPVHIEYQPAGRTQPEIMVASETRLPIPWGILAGEGPFDEPMLLVVIIERREVPQGFEAANPKEPMSQTNQKPKDPKAFWDYSLRWLQVRFIQAITSDPGVLIDVAAKQFVERPPMVLYPEPAQLKFADTWNPKITEKIEAAIQALNLTLSTAMRGPTNVIEMKASEKPPIVDPVNPANQVSPGQPVTPVPEPVQNPAVPAAPSQPVVSVNPLS